VQLRREKKQPNEPQATPLEAFGISVFTAPNPEAVGSNPTPATMGAERGNLEAPFLLSVIR